MTRVASLYLPMLSIELIRRTEPRAQLEARARSLQTTHGCPTSAVGGWRPGARWSHGDDAPAGSPQRWRGAAERTAPSIRPLILAEQVGNKQSVASSCPAAVEMGLVRGMTVAQARILVPDLDVRPSDTTADMEMLGRLALHAVRHWTPTAAVSGLDGLWLDLTGVTHLHGGEERFCRRAIGLCRRLGLTARIAVAGSPGAAHALARFGGQPIVRIACGGDAQALAGLPLACLRLVPEALAAAARFGLETVGDLLPLPRGPLARRLGLASIRRLDQALGRIAEPIVPLVPEQACVAIRRLLEPIVTAEAIEQVVADLLRDLVGELRKRGVGARALVLRLDRIDGSEQRISVGTVSATRDPVHLARLFHLRVERIDPGDGIETMVIAASHVEPLGATALASGLGRGDRAGDVATLVDQLAGRAGADAVFTVGAVESDVPERATCRTGPLDAPSGWPLWKRPVRLLRRPEMLTNVVALLPDHPPRRFAWRGDMHAVVAGDGPERIHGEWWRRDAEIEAVRDYYRVEDDRGARFWLFRRGDGIDPATGDLSWFMHGLFG
ncbi:Y-family DNA polymerase [Glacieibacterium megasporae]|uniref:Y-family DNA polymerase n=1 Tax=Glacieibacterium megasporae TaxID=2835787 RepID=UPI001C1E5538|nr:DNA polymerase Y family protein [Polymorphobacter megasporae]UAJ12715.1 DNA polymerase Y family protein [Polymorphobacter megasporae]